MRLAMSSVFDAESFFAGLPERTNSCIGVRSKASGRCSPVRPARIRESR